jgi:hypothetical protein
MSRVGQYLRMLLGKRPAIDLEQRYAGLRRVEERL